MTGRLVDIETRIETVDKLASVISAMRGIAAARAQEARRHVDSIRIYAETIGEAIGHALSFLPQSDLVLAHDGTGGRRAVILIAAEQGFAGGYSERVFDVAEPLLTDPHDLFLVGERGFLVAEERDHAVHSSVAMIGQAQQATALATQLTETVFDALALGRVTQVCVVHAMPNRSQAARIVTRHLVPFDYSRFPPPASGIAPLITLPPERLLARLVEEYVFSELAEAVMLAFSAENEARMRAMIAAHENVTDTLETLVSTSWRLRQEEITEEIVELSTGAMTAG
ncbi:F0F1 ATP synthase subunit gamma [Aliiruegeria lutimaris]|uniref:F-type H+-transporting ATPase subunit gamma n=1 Tax=Aliiruegeria lutimaris TaxID=571298 RepID=A0A1G9IGT2_9RHOB|nr:FoF1 ATP synthase subunit gamma [Aliiruegeria lutimaris]SDL24256.1 F-type H+-transporting ATPase subunit gamma [Aliiruegeria lutimaris]